MVRRVIGVQEESIDKIVSKVELGLKRKVLPRRKELGVSGLYQLRDDMRNVVAIFKPIDEEPVEDPKPKTTNEEHVKYARKLSNDNFVNLVR